MGDLVHGSDNKIKQDCKEAKDKKNITEGFTEDGHKTRDKNLMEEFTEDEEKLIVRVFSLVGERWSLIAGRIPGRTADEIKVYWTSKGNSSSQK